LPKLTTQHRVDSLRKRLAQLKIDAILVSSLPNIRYLFGFTGTNGLALVTQDHSLFITDRRYQHQSSFEVENANISIAETDLISALPVNRISHLKNLGIESAHLSTRDFFNLKKMNFGAKLMGTERLIERLMRIKDENEIKHIKDAARICVSVFDKVLHNIKPGMPEFALSAEISYQAKLSGSENDPFEPLVVSGRRAALVHGRSSNKKIAPGEFVIIDFGATRQGYAADFTRTIIMGSPTQKQIHLHQLTLQALEAAENAAKPGITGKQLDAVARNIFIAHHHGEYFCHSLGHGLGLNVHELPRIGERSDDPLEPGNVIALEPGIYNPEFGGIRIEDDFLVHSDGLENLTSYPRGLFSVACD